MTSKLLENIKERGIILYGSGVVCACVASVYGLGITWSLLVGVTLCALISVGSKISEDNPDSRNSVERLHNWKDAGSRKERLLAKKKENYDKKRVKPTENDTNADNYYVDSGVKRSQEMFDENLYGNIDYEAASGYNGVFAMPNFTSGQFLKRNIPSLKSPQPLLSAFHSRVSKREYNSPSIQEKNNPLSPRSVFDSLQNRSLMSPVNKAWTVKEASMFSNQMLEPQKAVSPPSGKYFSRIRHCISDDSKPIFATPTIKKCTGKDNEKDAMLENLDGSLSTEAIVKVLQEKTASKRKRAFVELPDTPSGAQLASNKKRRVQDDVLDATVDHGKVERNKDIRKMDLNESGDVSVKHDCHESAAENLESRDTGRRGKRKENGVANRYGMNDSEVEAITDDESMEVDKNRSKRKEKEDVDNRKTKRSRADKGSTRTASSRTPKSRNGSKKSTPVRSIETQTPTQLDVNEKSASSPQTPKTLLKTPYKKVFVSGFPSNLKPGTTEKRRKIPIYSGTLGHNENIETSMEEYGCEGVSIAAYTADRKAALERVNALMDDNVADVDASPSNATTSLAASAVPLQSKPLSSLQTPQSLVTTSSSNALQYPAQSSSSQPPMLAQVTPSVNLSSTTSALSEKSKTTEAPLSLNSSSITSSQQLSTAKNPTTASEKSSNDKVSLPTVVFGAPSSAPSAATVTSIAAPLSSSAIFGQSLSTSTVLSSGIFGAQSLSTVAQTSASVVPSFSFGQLQEVTKTVQSSPVKPLVPLQTEKTFSGFNFGAISASGTSAVTAPVAQSIAVTSVSETAPLKPDAGFTFGKPVVQQQRAVAFGSTAQNPHVSQVKAAANPPNFGGFSFGTSKSAAPSLPSSSSASSSLNPVGSFSFGTNSLSKPTTSTTSSSSILGGGGFNFNTTKSSAASFGGFSFASSAQASKNDSSVTGSLPAGSVFATSNHVNPASSSVFQTPPSKPTFGSSGTPSAATNLFGTPVTTSALSAQPIFGGSQSNASAPLISAPATAQPAMLFGSATQSSSSAVPVFGASSQSSNSTGSLFGAAAANTGAGGSVFGAAPQTSTTSGSIFGAPTQSTNKNSIFGNSAQATQQSGSVFGSNPSSISAAPVFGAPAQTSSFSFGNTQNTSLFSNNVKATPEASKGFSFGSNPQSASVNPQSGSNSFGMFGGQTGSGSNPFATNSIFGQTPAVTTATTSGFAFGTAAAPAFGQVSSNQPSFGATPAFAPNGGQTKPGGFNFAQSAAQKPTSFSFGGGGGAPSTGFASRPGTPTPFNNTQAPSSDVFGTPQQPQGVGFAMGSGAPNRPTVRGRRRTRR